MTLNPSDKPVSVPGKARVYRQPATPDQKETLVYEEPLKTDKQGAASSTGRTRRPATSASPSRRGIRRSSRSAGRSASGWMAPSLPRAGSSSRDIALLVENPYYEQDQTAKVLLVAPAPDSTVLLIREANNEILEQRGGPCRRPQHGAQSPAEPQDVPNVFLTAIHPRRPGVPGDPGAVRPAGPAVRFDLRPVPTSSSTSLARRRASAERRWTGRASRCGPSSASRSRTPR